ncbi:DUF167 domain-containing protein [Roseospira marina]|uniref:UPF0235 protein F1188_16710 n=1 Tax=Roseospira marina TaxID=140057 RepID=A0A5M6I7W9_9PROT|nr:DUF167 domain-containing protein [Roseospira marina]
MPVVAEADGGCRLSVRLTPKAARSRIESIEADADGQPWLRATVTAVPENGKANTALIALLAKAWRLPKGAFTVTSGATARRKTLRIDGGAATVEEVAAHLSDLPRR